MFDIGWTEMAIIVLVALIVIGPKDLPRALRTVGQWTRKARALTREFQSGIDEMVREAELDDARKAIESARNLDLNETIEREIDPTGEVSRDVREAGEVARRTASGAQDEKLPAAEKAPKALPEPEREAAGPEVSEKVDEPQQRAEVIQHPLKVAPPHSLGERSEKAPSAATGAAVETGKRGKSGG